jgi:Tfp pilus assembly protein PilO
MILASIIGFFMYTKPMYTEAKSNDAKLEQVSDALKKANQLSEIRNRLTEKYNQIPKEDLDRIRKMLPDSVENIGLIIELNNIANSKGVELVNPTIGGSGNTSAPTGATALSSDGKKYGSISMSFSVTTTYDKFIEFLEELENSLRLVDITTLTFNSPDERTGISTFSVGLQTYWLK